LTRTRTGPVPDERWTYKDLGALGQGFTDQHRIELFGARYWTGGGPPVWTPGAFISPTAYKNRVSGKSVIETSDPARLEVDRATSGIAICDEVLNASPELLDAFLGMISSGVVPTVGAKAANFPVGCTLVFGTNLETLDSVVEGHVYERGRMTEAFRRRLGTALQVPRLADMPFSSV